MMDDDDKLMERVGLPLATDMLNEIRATAKQHNRKYLDQIREYIRMGMETEKRAGNGQVERASHMPADFPEQVKESLDSLRWEFDRKLADLARLQAIPQRRKKARASSRKKESARQASS